jgi:hypothetical protein
MELIVASFFFVLLNVIISHIVAYSKAKVLKTKVNY